MAHNELYIFIAASTPSMMIFTTSSAATLTATSSICKTKEITKEIQAFVKRPEMKRDYPVKLTVKPGVKPNTVVVDIAGAGATVMGTKLGDLAKKLDKTADIKTKKEIKRVPVK